MDQTPIPPDTVAVDAVPTPMRPICGFWIRLLAFLIDLAILRVVGVILGAILGDTFVTLGNFARLIGLAIVLAYFGILQSRDGGGQSLGQRVTRIRVVGADGNSISTFRSVCRTAILWLPALLNQLVIPVRALVSPMGVALGIFWGVLAGAFLYLYLFNRRTRQSVHDVICRTYVVNASATGPVNVGGISRVHYFVFPAVVVVIGVLGAVLASSAASGPLKTTYALADHLGAVKGGTVVGVRERYLFSSDGGRYHTLQVIVVPAWDAKPEALASEVGEAVLDECPEVDDFDSVTVDVMYAYNILIHRSSDDYCWMQSPNGWQRGAGGPPQIRSTIHFF